MTLIRNRVSVIARKWPYRSYISGDRIYNDINFEPLYKNVIYFDENIDKSLMVLTLLEKFITEMSESLIF